MKEHLDRISVGEKFDTIPDADRFLWYSGGTLNITNSGGFITYLFMPDISEKEIEHFKKSQIKTKILTKRRMIITYIRFKGSPLVFELPFDPTIYPERPEIKSNIMNIISIDSRNLIVKSIRTLTIPNKLLSLWKQSWKEDYSKYNDWIRKLQNKELLDVWDSGVYIGKLGTV